MRRETVSEILTRSLESSEVQPSSAKEIEIESGDWFLLSVAFFADAKHVVCNDLEGKIRRWRVEDGMKVVGTPMAGSYGCNIAVSRDGKWIVGGAETRTSVQVWNAENGKEVIEFKAHSDPVQAVDVSPDSTRIASGSEGGTACVWSLSTGKRLLGPWEHDDDVFAVKFSPDGRFIATATETVVRIYVSRDGNLVVDVPLRATYSINHSLAWSGNSKHLFVISSGEIFCLDASTGATLSQWSIHGDKDSCIALASDGAFIAASSGSSVSFWDTTTHKQIGSVIEHTGQVELIAISASHDMVVGSEEKTSLRSLCHILPSSYCDHVSTFDS